MQLRGAGRAIGYEFAKAEMVRVALVGRASEDFVLALKNHAKVRGLAKTGAYWVCAYATGATNAASLNR